MATPTMPATISPRTRIACSSFSSPAPSDCAVNATVPMRRKANSQNRQSKITDAIATPPSSVASPSRPIAVVETMPINGVVRFAIIAGPAMAKTCLVVTCEGEFTALLQFDDHAVLCSRVGQFVHPAQHVIAHVGEDQLSGIDLAEMRFERLQAEMVLDDPVVIIGFGDEQVGIARRRDQRFRPFGVGAVADDAAFRLDAIGEE